MNENFAKIWLFGITIMFFFTCFLGQGWLIGVVAMLTWGIVKMR